MKEIGFLPDMGLLHPKTFNMVKQFIGDEQNAEVVKKYGVKMSFSHGMECIVLNGVTFYAAAPDRSGKYQVSEGEGLLFSSLDIQMKAGG